MEDNNSPTAALEESNDQPTTALEESNDQPTTALVESAPKKKKSKVSTTSLYVAIIVIAAAAAVVTLFLGTDVDNQFEEVLGDSPLPPPTRLPTPPPTPFPIFQPATRFPTIVPTPQPVQTNSPNTDQVLFPEEIRNGDNYIGLFLLNGMSDAAFDAFQSAANRWSAIVNGTVPDPGRVPAGLGICGVIFDEESFIDHLIIFAEVKPIDGVNGVLGSAGPCGHVVLPLLGKMTFDSADIQNLVAQGAVESVILHEMAHVLGIGSFTLRRFDLLKDPVLKADGTLNNANNQPKMNGTNAIEQYRLQTGNSNEQFVPVEDGTTNGRDIFSPKTQGRGSVDSHWDEDFFLGELMAFSINVNLGPPPMSATTIAALEDLGYEVDLSLAEAYSIDTARAKRLRGGGTEFEMLNDILPFESVPLIPE